jgi:hypothetical protein
MWRRVDWQTVAEVSKALRSYETVRCDTLETTT